MPDLYKYLNAKKGDIYFNGQIELFSMLSRYPGIDRSRKLKCNNSAAGYLEIMQ